MTDIDVDALAPCPLCGGAMMFRKALWPSDGNTDDIIHASPSTCGLMGFSTGTTDESVISAWNTRAQSAPAPDDVREAVARGLYNHEWSRLDGMGKIWGENTDGPYWLALADAAIAAYRAT